MSNLRLSLILLALMAVSFQGLATTVDWSCSNSAAKTGHVQTHDSASDAHAHHSAHAGTDAAQSPLHCEPDCECASACMHACHLSLVQPSLTLTAQPRRAEPLHRLAGETHLAYTDPLLRPPAAL